MLIMNQSPLSISKPSEENDAPFPLERFWENDAPFPLQRFWKDCGKDTAKQTTEPRVGRASPTAPSHR